MDSWKADCMGGWSMLVPNGGEASSLEEEEEGGGRADWEARGPRGSAGSGRIPVELLKNVGFRERGKGVA